MLRFHKATYSSIALIFILPERLRTNLSGSEVLVFLSL